MSSSGASLQHVFRADDRMPTRKLHYGKQSRRCCLSSNFRVGDKPGTTQFPNPAAFELIQMRTSKSRSMSALATIEAISLSIALTGKRRSHMVSCFRSRRFRRLSILTTPLVTAEGRYRIYCGRAVGRQPGREQGHRGDGSNCNGQGHRIDSTQFKKLLPNEPCCRHSNWQP
jgi:hypothetical protein